MAALYVVLAYALDLMLGLTGILPLCLLGFAGIGAYIGAIFSVNHVGSYFVEIAIAVILAALLSISVSLPSLRLRDDYFVLATFAFQLLLTGVFVNWTTVTKGQLGIRGIQRPYIWGHSHSSPTLLLALCATLALGAFLVVARIDRSPFGRVLRAIKTDEILAEALGKNTTKFKIVAFAISAALASAVGVTYSHYVQYVDPTSFDLGESILVMSMVIIGGAGSRFGPALGAVLLVSIPEALRFMHLPTSDGPNAKQIIFSILLLGVILRRPQGIVGDTRNLQVRH